MWQPEALREPMTCPAVDDAEFAVRIDEVAIREEAVDNLVNRAITADRDNEFASPLNCSGGRGRGIQLASCRVK
jgi:hypothetical protein